MTLMRSTLLGTAVAIALSGTARAASFNGWYIGLEGGANWVGDWDQVQFTPPPTTATTSFDTGWAVLGTVGYSFWGNWRAEFEAGYRSNDIDTVLIGGAPSTTTGDLWEVSLMGNFIYDLNLTDKLSVSLGVGVGADYAELSLGPVTVSDDDWNFAYQGIAGINYGVGQQTALFLNYRYLRVHEPDFVYTSPGFTIDGDDFGKHTVTVGLRYSLQPSPAADIMAPPPDAAPPPTSSAPPQQFIVFFGFNKYNLTSEAMRVISEAVVAAKQTGSASVLVTGHTDTKGSNEYNMRLSNRRSNAVKAEMVRQGVSPGSITTTGRGETELLVQTADGVKEPQNRRAAIDLN